MSTRPAFSSRLLLGWPLLSLFAAACGTAEPATDAAGGASTGGQALTGGAAGSGGTSTTGGAAPTGGANGSGGAGPADGGAAGSGPTSTGGTPGSGGGVGGNAVPSPGCSSEDLPVFGPRTIDVDGTEREYILTLPGDYDAAHPYRLIFGFHGAQYDAEWVANGEEPLTGPYFGLEEESAGSAVFVAGQALTGSWSNTDGRDLAYVEAMLESLEAELCIDESRVFATGFSMGGIMTERIGCTLGDVFRAIAPMSPSLPTECDDGTEPIAYWSSHGLSDTTITPEQGALARDEFLTRNACTGVTSAAAPAGCVSYEGCSEGNPVGYCTFEGAHVPAPFAGVAIWAFFSQF